MRKLAIVCLFFALSSCIQSDDETCYGCSFIIESNERALCGYANNGFDILAEEPYRDRICGDDDLRVVKDAVNMQQTLPSTCGGNYTLIHRLKCSELP